MSFEGDGEEYTGRLGSFGFSWRRAWDVGWKGGLGGGW